MPHGCGSSLMGEISSENATLIDALEGEGAIVLGKTETTEFAALNPAPTKNPHNLDYSPGGSSAGSAAAVAAGEVPLSVGSQTNGSVIRPASFCGVFAIKPSAGLISRTNVFEQSPTLDQMGLFASSLNDLALGLDCLSVHDSRDPHSFNLPRPKCFEGYHATAPIEPNFAVFRLPYSDRQSNDCTEGFREIVDALGKQVDILDAPPSFDQLIETHRIIHHREAFVAFDTMGFIGNEALSNCMTDLLNSGAKVPESQYQEALEIKVSLDAFFNNFFEDFDVILSPSAAGEAPQLSDGNTGDPIFCTIWTLAGIPTLNLPLLKGSKGLPIGMQMIGRKNDDARLFRTARWFMKNLFEEDNI